MARFSLLQQSTTDPRIPREISGGPGFDRLDIARAVLFGIGREWLYLIENRGTYGGLIMKVLRRSRRFLLLFSLCLAPLAYLAPISRAQVAIGISVHVGPPALPVYEQPLCPGDGYLWTPGYWAYGPVGYYWVPGVWVRPPRVGVLWTPGYWGFAGGLYGWHAGYWGPHVGFYGGINYGFGYGGAGFFGGEWRGGAFFYNRSVVNVNVTNVTNVYNRTVIVNNVHTSFNGPGGVGARPSREEEAYAREPHTEALAAQREHEHAA